ncbi:hypothetical protein H4R20_003909 [Coemansia guatemalensis]|uniref:dolichol kinase n=1 Tax=Coemansia guatemalensis TaxID=2761395 RepID=A0A9W8I0W7_9FUNG|nr:hypothetical protein H4R20_003909 [Coemansia guatemalensis]
MDQMRRVRLLGESCVAAGALLATAWHRGLPAQGGIGAAMLAAAAVTGQIGRRLHDGSASEQHEKRRRMFRPLADDGGVWAAVLVPLTVLAADGGAGLSRAGAWALAAALAWAATMAAMEAGTWMRLGASAAGVAFLGWSGGAAALGLQPGTGTLALAGAAVAAHGATELLVRKLPRSFTLGEAAVAVQGAVIVAADLAARVVVRPAAVTDTQMATLLVEAVCAGLALLALLLAYVPARPAWVCAATATSAAAALLLAAAASDVHPLAWVAKVAFGCRSHMLVLGWWLVLAAASAMLCVRGERAELHSKRSGPPSSRLETPVPRATHPTTLALHVRRKAWHLAVVLAVVPGYAWARTMLCIALAAALAAFVVAEAVRVRGMAPVAVPLGRFLGRFTDARDAGRVVTSHFHLLLGCAVPVWVHPSQPVAALAGVLALGVADSAASLAGLGWGSRRWPASSKTVEGSAAFAASLFAATELTARVADVPGSWEARLATSVVLALLEAATEQNDNMLLPLTMAALARVPPLPAVALLLLSTAAALAPLRFAHARLRAVAPVA